MTELARLIERDNGALDERHAVVVWLGERDKALQLEANAEADPNRKHDLLVRAMACGSLAGGVASGMHLRARLPTPGQEE